MSLGGAARAAVMWLCAALSVSGSLDRSPKRSSKGKAGRWSQE
jgi:hypothetical protein